MDLNFQLGSFGLNTIGANDDAVLVVESTKNAFNTKIMAASPRHPLFFYAIRRVLDEIVDGNQKISVDVALQRAFQDFQKTKDHAWEVLPLPAPGTSYGVGDRSVRIVSEVEMSGCVKRVTETDADTKEEYEKMGWNMLDEQDHVDWECLRKMQV